MLLTQVRLESYPLHKLSSAFHSIFQAIAASNYCVRSNFFTSYLLQGVYTFSIMAKWSSCNGMLKNLPPVWRLRTDEVNIACWGHLLMRYEVFSHTISQFAGTTEHWYHYYHNLLIYSVVRTCYHFHSQMVTLKTWCTRLLQVRGNAFGFYFYHWCFLQGLLAHPPV